MNTTIREMTLNDYQAVVQLWQNTEGVGLSGADEKDKIELFLQRNPNLSFVALQEEHVVGAVMCGHDGRRGFIYHLAVDATCRKQGLGRQLVERCLNAFSQIGIEKCHIMVFEQNTNGLQFWEKMGWQARKDLVLMSRTV